MTTHADAYETAAPEVYPGAPARIRSEGARAIAGTSNPTEWLTVAMVAAELHVHQMTVRNWIWSGQLKAERFGSKLIRISRTAMEDMHTSATPWRE